MQKKEKRPAVPDAAEAAVRAQAVCRTQER